MLDEKTGMSSGKTIQIYLPDGNPRGIRIADMTSRIVQAALIPRARLDDAYSRPKGLNQVGVYLLIGNTENETFPRAYIGEAEDCLQRLKEHNRSKEFWNVAIIISSKTEFFTKSHVRFLEWYCIKEAIEVGRFVLENNTAPNPPYLPESTQADLIDNVETIRILVSTLGYPIFERYSKVNSRSLLWCKSKDANAFGQFTEEGLFVMKGSTCNISEARSIPSRISALRKQLVEDGILVQKDDAYVFQKNYNFTSPSTASSVILARNSNGWTSWKYENEKTMDEVLRKR